MKKCMRFFIFIGIIILFPTTSFAEFKPTNIPRAYILMDYDTGTSMVSYNANEPYPIASVTKVMTMLVCMDAVQAGKISFNDMVTASEYACSMGGSQIYLEPGEQMSVSDLIKSIAVGSANDASVAMAEYVMGSEAAFVDAMNERAKGLGMKNTHFVNCNGLDTDNHYSTALDVAKMSRELLKHNAIRPYLSIWMDTVRNGEFGLTNTNKLIRFYEGAIGVKTGMTTNAKYCLSSAATRDGLTLIAVVLGADTSPDRFETSKQLLNYGFSNYKISTLIKKGEEIGTVSVKKGTEEKINAVAGEDFKIMMQRSDDDRVERKMKMEGEIKAPVKKGDIIGTVEFLKNGEIVGKTTVEAEKTVQRIGTIDTAIELIKIWMLK